MGKKMIVKVGNTKQKKYSFTRRLAITCGIIVLVLIAVLGTSYAYFQTRIDSNKEYYIKGADFNIIFDDGSEFITMANAGPETDADGLLNTPYTFTINNDNSIATKTKVYFSDTETTVPLKYIKMSYKVNNAQWSTPQKLDTLTNDIIVENVITQPNTTTTYSVVLWISDDMPNSENGTNYMNTSYKSKISVETVQASTEDIANNN